MCAVNTLNARVSKSGAAPSPAAPAPIPQFAPPPLPGSNMMIRSRYRTILDSLYEAVFITDISGKIFEVNARAEQITGLSQQDLQTQPVSMLVPTLTDDILHSAVEHLMTTSHVVVEGWCIQADGNRMRVQIAVSRLDSPNRQELVISLRNNTRQYAARMQLLNERIMLQNVACGIAMVDTDARVQYVNTAFTNMWRGDTQNPTIGRRLDEIWPRDVATRLAEPLESGAQWSGEISVAVADGEPLSFHASSVPCLDRDGKVEGLIVSFIDVTALKAAEETIRREAELQKEYARHEGNFAGSLNILAIPDLFQLIASSNKTGTLEIMDAQSRETAYASFDGGRIVCAACGEILGEPAVEMMIQQGGRMFRFREDAIRHRDPSVTRSTMSLVLDAIRILDEKKGKLPPE